MSGWSMYENGFPLEDLIHTSLYSYEDDRRNHWAGKSKGHAMLLQVLDQIADFATRSTDELVLPENRDPELPVLADLEEDFRNVALENVQLRLAWQYSTDVEGKAERCLHLSEHLLAVRPPEQVLRYLRRVSRCYILDFRAECLVMCRAVLENAVKSTYHRKRVPFPPRKNGESEMRTRLDGARQRGWLTSTARQRAWNLIWLGGNKAAHEDPDLSIDVFDTIKTVIEVTGQLSQA